MYLLHTVHTCSFSAPQCLHLHLHLPSDFASARAHRKTVSEVGRASSANHCIYGGASACGVGTEVPLSSACGVNQISGRVNEGTIRVQWRPQSHEMKVAVISAALAAPAAVKMMSARWRAVRDAHLIAPTSTAATPEGMPFLEPICTP